MKIPNMVPVRKQDELRKCQSCGLTVMAKGDWHGWKGVDIGGGQLDWFCDKTLCRQARDETITRRSRELMAEQVQQERQGAENRELIEARRRIADLEMENEVLKAKRQTTATEPEPEVMPAALAVSAVPIETHLLGDGAKKALCGHVGGPFARALELTWDTNPCSQCALIWSQIQTGERPMPKPDPEPEPDPRFQFAVNIPSETGDGTKYRVVLGAGGMWTCECEAFKYRSTCKHIAVAQKLRGDAQVSAQEAQAVAPVVSPVPASAAASALYGERPQPPKLEELPKFTPALITKVQTDPGSYVGRVILVPPEAYPDMDMAAIDPEKLRSGIGALMGLPVDRIERAHRNDGSLAGIVFTLKRL